MIQCYAERREYYFKMRDAADRGGYKPAWARLLYQKRFGVWPSNYLERDYQHTQLRKATAQ